MSQKEYYELDGTRLIPHQNVIHKMKPEENRLKTLVSSGVWEYLKLKKAFIAGGAITSIFTRKDVNDIDVYFRSEEDVCNLVLEAYSSREEYISSYELILNNVTKRSLYFQNENQDFQAMTFRYFKSANEIFDSFDFTVAWVLMILRMKDLFFIQIFLNIMLRNILSLILGRIIQLCQ